MKKETEKIRDGLYIKESFDGCRVVYPIRNEDGTLNWFNILTGGTWWKLVKLFVVLLIIAGMTLSYMRDTRECRELLSHPCTLLPNITRYCSQQSSGLLYSSFDGSWGEIDEKALER